MKTMTFLLSFLLAACASAGTMDLGQATYEVKFGVRGEKMTLKEVGVMRSQPNEDKDTFMIRVGTFMNGWTEKNRMEICSVIYQKGNQYAVVPTTSHSQIGCLMPETFKTRAHFLLCAVTFDLFRRCPGNKRHL